MAAFRASQDGLKLHIGSCFALAKTMERRVVQFHFAIGFYSGSRRITKRGPFQSSIDRSPTRSLAFSIGVVGANQGLEPYKAAVKTNGISSVVCHRSHPAPKTQLAARASRGLYTSEHNSNGIFKIKRGRPFL
jgi:hypothetical protein